MDGAARLAIGGVPDDTPLACLTPTYFEACLTPTYFDIPAPISIPPITS